MVLIINNYGGGKKKTNYVEKIHDHINNKFSKLEYQGMISYNEKKQYSQPMWVWKKVENTQQSSETGTETGTETSSEINSESSFLDDNKSEDDDILDLLNELIHDHNEQSNLRKIESLEQKLINNLDENSYSELIKLKSQLNRD